MVTLSTHTGGEKKYSILPQYGLKKDCIRSCKMDCMVQQCYTKKITYFQAACKDHVFELYSV